MKGDFSLDLSLRAQRYSSVRFQQGRVLTDSDWNEQVEIVNLRAERTAKDVIGECGAPMDPSGFAVRATTTALAIDAVSGGEVCVVGEDAAVFLLTGGSPDLVALRADASGASTAHLRAVHFPAPNQGYAVGDRGTLLSITPGSPGPLVSSLPLPDITTDLRGVHFVSLTQGYAAGEEGKILFITRTATGATVKKIEPSGVSGCLHGVHFVDATDGYAVGDDATVLAITAGSPDPIVTRIDIPSGLAGDLCAVHCVNRDQCYAVGKDGTILFIDRNATPKATKLTVPGVTSHLRGVSFSGSRGCAVGDDATIVSIDIAGTTPILKKVLPPSGVEADLRGTVFLSTTVGYAVGEDGTVLMLRDLGGATGVVASLLSPLPAASVRLSAGRFYAHGILCELHEEATYLNQPQSAGPPTLAPGTHLLYLDAWQRHVTYIEDPAILEVALGGPDTTTRTQTIAQVKALSLDSVSPPQPWSCITEFPAWTALTEPRQARLRARARPEESPSNVCELPARAGFRRLENQLYRVEIHTADPAKRTFKWSRENGSVTYPVDEITEDAAKSQTVVKVGQRGRDPNLDLVPENWVELLDDDLVLANRPGRLLEYEKDGNDPLEIVLKGLPGAGFTAGRDPKRHPLLRRWDHRAPTGGDGALPLEEGKWLNLEDGVQVYFEPGGDYRPGDYWLIPARSVTSDVIWPLDECGHPEALLPRGIQHAYCRLALVEVATDSTISVLSDCRPEFPALTELTQIYYVSGDGQDGPPGERLPKPLQVRVANGQHPVEGAQVRFEVGSHSGSLDGSPSVSERIVTTDAEGFAECPWRLAAYTRSPDNRSQRVTASLLDASANAVAGQVVRFNATASIALEYVSGDGQEARPGLKLPHPLKVRVANGQHPVANARVNFNIAGGGTLTPPGNPKMTDANGIAVVDWQLGNGGLQRVVAELLDAAGTPVQSVGFNATLSVASEVAYTPTCTYLQGKTTVQAALDALCVKPDQGAHCVTIGKDNPLTNASLITLLKLQGGRLCLCFSPGIHEVEGLTIDVSGTRDFHLSIKGCGHAAIVTFKQPTTFTGFASIELADLSLFFPTHAGLAFMQCGVVRVTNVAMNTGDAALKIPLLHFRDSDDVTVSGCDINANGRDNQASGMAVIVENEKGVVRFSQNDVRGTVSLYGFPGAPAQLEDFVRALAKILPQVKQVKGTPDSAFFADRNRFDWLTIGSKKVDELKAARLDSELVGLQACKLTDNVFRAGGNIVFAESVTVNASVFLRAVENPNSGPTLGSAIGHSAWGIGNDSPLAEIREVPIGPVLNLLSKRMVSGPMMSHLRLGNTARVEMT